MKVSKIEIFQDIKKELLEAALENINIEKTNLYTKCLGNAYCTNWEYIFHHRRKEYSFIYDKNTILEQTMDVNIPDHLVEDFDFVLEQERNLEKESARLFQYIRVIFNECETLADLYAGSPDILHKFYPEDAGEKHTLSEEVLEKLNSIKDFVQTFIKERMLTNLITT